MKTAIRAILLLLIALWPGGVMLPPSAIGYSKP
jgi:hypothetical protein